MAHAARRFAASTNLETSAPFFYNIPQSASHPYMGRRAYFRCWEGDNHACPRHNE